MSGYIKLYREIQKNKFWREKPFSKGQAWVDLLLMANHADNGIYKKGHVYTSLRILADNWGWSVHKVLNFLSQLEKNKMIKKCRVQKRNEKGTEEGTREGTVLAIVKWDFYQDAGNSNGNSVGNKTGTKKGNYQEDKKKGLSLPPNGERVTQEDEPKDKPVVKDDEYYKKFLEEGVEIPQDILKELLKRGLV